MKQTPAIRVLVVDDDAPFAQSLERRLTHEGYEVALAVDGREGMKAIVALEPQLVISDWMMPHVDGLELCQAVKAGLGQDAPYFILLTARGDAGARQLALDSGADDYLIKPCEPEELSARIRIGARLVTLARELKRMMTELEELSGRLEAMQEPPAGLAGRLPLCRECNRIRVADGVWEDLAHFVEDSGLVGLDADTCPDCLEQRVDAAGRRRSRAA